MHFKVVNPFMLIFIEQFKLNYYIVLQKLQSTMENIESSTHKYPIPSISTKNERRQNQINELISILKSRSFIQKDHFSLLVKRTSSILQIQPTVLSLPSPITIVGDIHGQFYDLLELFNRFGYPPNTTYLFLGDYVDRGDFCIEVMTLLLKLKALFPTHIYLLRGNHEGKAMTGHFNFKLQCERKYNQDVYQQILELFMRLPLCAVIDNKYFAVHGGISPNLTSIDQITKINRFAQLTEEQPFFDLLWGDPCDAGKQSWVHNTDRGCSYFFSPIQAEAFLNRNQIKMIIRGHQVNASGFKYQRSIQKKPLTLTIFSAPNYCKTYGNKAVVAQINGEQIDIKHFQEGAQPFALGGIDNVFQLSVPILCRSVTKMFKHLLKKEHQIGHIKRSSTERRENNNFIKVVELLDMKATADSDKIMSFLQQFSRTQSTSQSQNQLPIEELITRVISMRNSDVGEKYPHSFGPKLNHSSMHKKLQKILQDDEQSVSPF